MDDWEQEGAASREVSKKKEKSDDDDSVHGFSDEDEDEEALLGDDWDAEEKPEEEKTEVAVKPNAPSQLVSPAKANAVLRDVNTRFARASRSGPTP